MVYQVESDVMFFKVGGELPTISVDEILHRLPGILTRITSLPTREELEDPIVEFVVHNVLHVIFAGCHTLNVITWFKMVQLHGFAAGESLELIHVHVMYGIGF